MDASAMRDKAARIDDAGENVCEGLREKADSVCMEDAEKNLVGLACVRRRVYIVGS